MYTKLDKALVALVMGVIGVVGMVWHPVAINDTTVATIVSLLTPVIVYFWPNAPKDQ